MDIEHPAFEGRSAIFGNDCDHELRNDAGQQPLWVTHQPAGDQRESSRRTIYLAQDPVERPRVNIVLPMKGRIALECAHFSR
jgi:hypothetical protein